MLRYVSLTLIVASVVLAAPYFAFMCDGSRWEDVSNRGGGEGGGGKAAEGEGEKEVARISVTRARAKEVGLLGVPTELHGQQPAAWAEPAQARGSWLCVW